MSKVARLTLVAIMDLNAARTLDGCNNFFFIVKWLQRDLRLQADLKKL